MNEHTERGSPNPLPGITHDFGCTHEPVVCRCYAHEILELRAAVESLIEQRDTARAEAAHVVAMASGGVASDVAAAFERERAALVAERDLLKAILTKIAAKLHGFSGWSMTQYLDGLMVSLIEEERALLDALGGYGMTEPHTPTKSNTKASFASSTQQDTHESVKGAGAVVAARPRDHRPVKEASDG